MVPLESLWTRDSRKNLTDHLKNRKAGENLPQRLPRKTKNPNKKNDRTDDLLDRFLRSWSCWTAWTKRYTSSGHSGAPAGQNNEKTTKTRFVLEPGDTNHVSRRPHLIVWAHTKCMDVAAILPNVRMDGRRNSRAQAHHDENTTYNFRRLFLSVWPLLLQSFSALVPVFQLNFFLQKKLLICRMCDDTVDTKVFVLGTTQN